MQPYTFQKLYIWTVFSLSPQLNVISSPGFVKGKMIRKTQNKSCPTIVVTHPLELKNKNLHYPKPIFLGPIWVEIKLHSVTE